MSHCLNLCLLDDIDVELPFICLFVICLSSLVRCLLKPLDHFNQIVFLIWGFKSCVCGYVCLCVCVCACISFSLLLFILAVSEGLYTNSGVIGNDQH